MSEDAKGRKWTLRRKYLIDAKSQLGITAQILGVLTVICLVYAGGVLLFTRDKPLFELEQGQIRGFIAMVIGAYMVISALIFGLLAVALTHRFVGPAQVIGRAIDAMMKGKYDSRLSLRKSDHLKDLAAAVERLRTQIRTNETNRSQAFDDLASCLAENDVDGAKEIVQRLKADSAKPVEEKKPAEEPAAV